MPAVGTFLDRMILLVSIAFVLAWSRFGGLGCICIFQFELCGLLDALSKPHRFGSDRTALESSVQNFGAEVKWCAVEG